MQANAGMYEPFRHQSFCSQFTTKQSIKQTLAISLFAF